MVAPSLFCDVNGDYYGSDHAIHRNADFTNYTTFSLWDTYRAAMPLMTVLHPEKMADIVQTMLTISDEQGRLPVWHLWGNETDCMVGNPGIPVVADAIVKGIGGFDREKAFEAIRKAEDAKYFEERSHSYRNYFDPATRFMRGRDSKKGWRTPFNAFASTHRADDYCEGNAWQYTWLAPHDVKGLEGLFGSRAKMIEKLDSLFTVSSVIEGGETSPDISGLIGQYAHGNEPSHHILYLYTMLGQPWKTAGKGRCRATRMWVRCRRGTFFRRWECTKPNLREGATGSDRRSSTGPK